MRIAFAALLLAGCDALFGLDPVPDAVTVDSPPLADAHIPVVVPGCWDAFYQDDEDLDGIVDGCDNCPFDTDIAQVDSDGDGIGDECDPNPMAAVERRAFFDPMVNLNFELWEIVGTDNVHWGTNDAIAGFGYKQYNRGNGEELDSTLRITGRTFEQPALQLRVNSGNPDNDEGDVSAIGAYVILEPLRDTVPYGVACAVQFPGLDATVSQGLARVTTDGAQESTSFEVKRQKVQVRINTHVAGSLPTQPVVPTCEIFGPDHVAASLQTTVVPTAARIGLWSTNASGTFLGILVYERIP